MILILSNCALTSKCNEQMNEIHDIYKLHLILLGEN